MTIQPNAPNANKNQNQNTIDITQSRLLAGIFESLPTALITVTLEGYIADANAAAEAFLNWVDNSLLVKKLIACCPLGPH